MKLEEYLEALKTCPDEELRDELGIYDNCLILLNADIEKVARGLVESRNFIVESKEVVDKQSEEYKNTQHYICKIETEKAVRYYLEYTPGTVTVQLINFAWPLDRVGGISNKIREELKKEEKNYNMSITLHIYQDKKMEKVHDWRTIAIVISEIGKYILDQNIPALFPKSAGRDYDDYLRVTYHRLNI